MTGTHTSNALFINFAEVTIFWSPSDTKTTTLSLCSHPPLLPNPIFLSFPSPHKKEQQIWEKKPQKVHIFRSPSEISKAVCLQILSSSPFLLVVVRYTRQNCGLSEELVSVGFAFNLDKLEKI